jgi:hypothetical protein
MARATAEAGLLDAIRASTTRGEVFALGSRTSEIAAGHIADEFSTACEKHPEKLGEYATALS